MFRAVYGNREVRKTRTLRAAVIRSLRHGVNEGLDGSNPETRQTSSRRSPLHSTETTENDSQSCKASFAFRFVYFVRCYIDRRRARAGCIEGRCWNSHRRRSRRSAAAGLELVCNYKLTENINSNPPIPLSAISSPTQSLFPKPKLSPVLFLYGVANRAT